MVLIRQILYRVGKRQYLSARRYRQKSLRCIERSVICCMRCNGYEKDPLVLCYDGAPAESCRIEGSELVFERKKRNLNWADWVNLQGFVELTHKVGTA